MNNIRFDDSLQASLTNTIWFIKLKLNIIQSLRTFGAKLSYFNLRSELFKPAVIVEGRKLTGVRAFKT
jgi:hypothetical protein